MFTSYFKIAWRNLTKDRQFAFLNLIGLSTGLACTLFIYLWVYDELKMDRFHHNDNRLFQVMINQQAADRINTLDGTSGTLGETLKAALPEVASAVSTAPAFWFQEFSITYKDNTLGAKGNFVGKEYFSVFSFPLLQGHPSSVLADKNAIVLSKQLAEKLFPGVKDVRGKIVEWKWANITWKCIVTGVFKDMPLSSSSRYDFLLSLEAWKDINTATKDPTSSSGPFHTYLVLKPGTDAAAFNGKMAGFIKQRFKETNATSFLRKFSDGYLYGKYENGVQDGGRIIYVRLFILIALFILVIACINFMNLSTAKASRRFKEIGVKKVLGAGRRMLAMQFLGESILMSFASLLIALLMVLLLLPQFREVTDKQLSLHPDAGLVWAVLGITLLTGLLAGSYPALYLSGFNPVATLKGRINTLAGELFARKGLVVFQFVVSVAFIIAVMVVYRQIEFVQKKNLGYNKDNVIYFEMNGRVYDKQETFLAELKRIPGVVNASSIQQTIVMASSIGNAGVRWEGKNEDDQLRFVQMPVNYDLIETLGITMAAGRSFSRKFSTDKDGVILNETAAKMMGLSNPVGKVITMGGIERPIIGVAKDFHFNSLHEPIKPFIFRLAPNETLTVMAVIKGGEEKKTLQRIAGFYEKFNPGVVFSSRFLDSDFQAQYTSEKLVAKLSKYFAGLAVIISCLGLFGLAAFTAQRRRKEIGIRKVLGATVGNVVLMLTKDFLKLVLLAVLIAFPLAWWAMSEWLNGFAYRIPLKMDVLAIAGISILFITLLTIGFQALRAALANPAGSLRTE
jgi:putative ABC transport system permease protein